MAWLLLWPNYYSKISTHTYAAAMVSLIQGVLDKTNFGQPAQQRERTVTGDWWPQMQTGSSHPRHVNQYPSPGTGLSVAIWLKPAMVEAQVS